MMKPELVLHLDKTIDQMAEALIASAADLHSEREVLRSLAAAGFKEGDILALADQAVITAKAKRGIAA